MLRRLILLCGLGLVLHAGPASAGEPAPPPSDDPWSLYDRAFTLAAAGHEAEASALFRQILDQAPNSAAAPYASEMLRLFEARRTGVVASPNARFRLLPPGPAQAADIGTLLRNEQPTALARAELAVFQSIFGVALGLETSFILKVTDSKTVALFMMLGGGAGLGLSLGLTRGGITPGHATALNSGVVWGAWNGGMLVSILGVSGDPQKYGLLAVSQFAGLALGNAGWTLFHPSAGDVSLVNSGGIWTAVLAGLVANAASPNLNSTALQVTLLSATDLGLVVGAVLAHEFPMSRARVLIIDAGGLLGTLFGVGLSVLVGLENENHRAAFFSLGALGTASGLGLAAYFSRHWDLPDAPPVRVSIAPTERGPATFGLAYDF